MTARANQTLQEHPTLPYLANQERLDVFNLLTSGAQHLWSKNKLQEDRIDNALNALVPLIQTDPNFLAHLTSYVFSRDIENKDLRVLTAFVNALSTADGTPFSPGSKYNKPNWRHVSDAAIQKLNPKEALRVSRLGRRKFNVDGYLNLSSHFPSHLATALKKYLKYRENNIHVLTGAKNVGFSKTIQSLYRQVHVAPSDEAASILRWNQKDHEIEFINHEYDFTDKTDLEIAQLIQEKEIPFRAIQAELSRTGTKITPAIAAAMLEQATGNEAVISRKTFEDAGILTDPEVMALYEAKIATAKTALDRVQAIKNVNRETEKTLKSARAKVRKEQMGDIGKIYLHIDASGSMNEMIEFAKKKGSVIAEIVQNPRENFAWGLYDYRPMELPIPDEFVADAFEAILFGRTLGGGTDCFALYPQARQFGAEVDVQVTDGGHNVGDLRRRMREFHEQFPDYTKPKAMVLVDYSDGYWDRNGVKNPIKEAYEDNGIPVAVIRPEVLDSSALVVDSVKTAMLGPLATIDAIMDTPLLELPEWYESI